MYLTTVIGMLYGVYVLLVGTLMGSFVVGLTQEKRIPLKAKISLEVWIGFLIFLAVSFHAMTYLKLPWVRWEFMGKKLIPAKEILVDIKNYQFRFPETPLAVKAGEPVKFVIRSQDVTYGFGIFRTDGTMVFQIQVVPGHDNEIVWIFKDPGRYTIRSTEYSGPENWKMVLRDALVVE